jgi:predicted ester cyclase
MEEARETGVRSREVFHDHDERAPNIAEFTIEASGYGKVRLRGFPEAKTTVQNEVVIGPWVVSACTLKGTHTCAFDGPDGIIAATGRKVVVKCVQIGRYENGLSTDVKLYYDQVDLLTQLGLLGDTAAGVSPRDGYSSDQLFLETFSDHGLDNLTFKIAQ